MKKLLYILPLILLGSCKQTKFICNPQLVLPQQTVAAVSPDTNTVAEKPNANIQHEAEINTTKPISSQKKEEPKKYNKSRQILDKFLPKFNHPKDTLINNPGLKKAKDALDLEEKWLKAFFIFFGIGIFVALAFFGIIPLALGIGEDLLLYILFGAFIGYSITYYGIIIIFIMHIGLFKNYKEEKEKHLKYVLGFFLLPALILALLLLLIL